ncbi:MAG: DUF222 domain-containing protein [Acidimicrobiia bacterium]
MFDETYGQLEAIPRGLDEMTPGPVLAAFLSSIDVGEVSGYDRIVVLRAHSRMMSHYAARVYEDMAAVSDYMTEVDDDPELAVECAAAEIRVALHLTRRAADVELDFAIQLRQRLPRVWDSLAAGDIDLRRAKTIAYGTEHLPVNLARRVVDRIIDSVPGLTTGQLAARIRRLCVQTDPTDAQRRYDEALAERRVVSEPTTSGTAHLLALDLPPQRVAAITRRITRIAHSLRTGAETRSVDQIRADILLDLLQGTDTTTSRGGSKAVVDIQVDLETLTRLADTPGELAGYGPVIADIARQTAEQQDEAEWRYTVTHPDTRQPIANGVTRRRPTTRQRRTVEARNPTCIFPGCRMPATGCDLDHTIPWAQGGPTTISHMAPLCRHDHTIRHHGWTYQPLPNGNHRWTTRLGHIYTTTRCRPP